MTLTSSITVGDIKITALRDGEMVLPTGYLTNLSDEQAATIDGDPNNALSATNFNAFVIQSAGRTLLVDAGCRDVFGPTAGFLPQALSEAGLKPEDITDLFFTHMHPDHIAGSVTAENVAVFENAQLQIIDVEHKFWTTGHFEDVAANGKGWSEMAKGVLAAYGDRLTIVAADKEIIPGVTSIAIPGHTPGHAGFRADSGADSLVHMGDILHIQNMQLFNPKVATVFDVDPETALASRKRILDMVSADKLMCTNGHMLAPKFNHIDKVGDSYAIVS